MTTKTIRGLEYETIYHSQLMPEYLSTLNKENGTQSYTSRKFQDTSTQMRLGMINNRNFF